MATVEQLSTHEPHQWTLGEQPGRNDEGPHHYSATQVAGAEQPSANSTPHSHRSASSNPAAQAVGPINRLGQPPTAQHAFDSQLSRRQVDPLP